MSDQSTPTVSFRNFTSYRLKKQLEPSAQSAYQTGLYTHASGREAIAVSLDFKRKKAEYKTLVREADLLAMINEKHESKKTNVTVPQLFTVIDRGGRLVVVREFAEGVAAGRLTQGAKVTAYQECVKELRRIHDSLKPEEKAKLASVSEKSMRRAFPSLLMKAFVHDQGLLFTLLKLAYVFYRYRAPKSKSVKTIANRSLSAANIVCGQDRVYMIDVRHAVIASEGTDEALFPQLYYREVGTDTMRAYLDNVCDTPAAARRFLHLAAYYAAECEDFTNMQIFTDSIAPYVTGVFRANAQKNRALSLTVASSS